MWSSVASRVVSHSHPIWRNSGTISWQGMIWWLKMTPDGTKVYLIHNFVSSVFLSGGYDGPNCRPKNTTNKFVLYLDKTKIPLFLHLICYVCIFLPSSPFLNCNLSVLYSLFLSSYISLIFPFSASSFQYSFTCSTLPVFICFPPLSFHDVILPVTDSTSLFCFSITQMLFCCLQPSKDWTCVTGF